MLNRLPTFPKRFWLGAALLSGIAFFAIFADFLSLYPPGHEHRDWPNARPQFAAAPLRFWVRSEPYQLFGLIRCEHRLLGSTDATQQFWLGTDGLGRDVWARLWHGARLSLLIATIALLLAVPFALLVGGLAGYYGGILDFVLMRFLELLLALPALYLVIALRSALPLELPPWQIFASLALVIGLFGWAHLSRIVRARVLTLRTLDYITAAKALGASNARILLRHLLPQLTGDVMTQAALAAPAYILAEVTLSYLGLGVPDELPSWGNMLVATQGLHTMLRYWWNLAPLVALFLTSLSFHLIADGLRMRFDPRSGESAAPM